MHKGINKGIQKKSNVYSIYISIYNIYIHLGAYISLTVLHKLYIFIRYVMYI